MDPKLGPQRKTAGVRNLPKIDRQVAGKGSKQKQQGKAAKAFGGKVDFEANGTVIFKICLMAIALNNIFYSLEYCIERLLKSKLLNRWMKMVTCTQERTWIPQSISKQFFASLVAESDLVCLSPS